MRLIIATLLSFFATSGLFILMQFLIINDQEAPEEIEDYNFVTIVRIAEETHLETIREKAEKPPEPEIEPPPPLITMPGNDTNETPNTGPLTPVKPSIGLDTFGTSDTMQLPIVKVQPNYPRKALSRGLSGWVVVEFTVATNGTVKDAAILLNCASGNSNQGTDCSESPNSVFDRSALSAVAKFKYVPRVVDGQEVETFGVQNKIVFALAGS